MKNKKCKVKFTEDSEKELDSLPDEVYDEIVKITKGFKEGKLNPKKVGQPMKPAKLKIMLKCP